MYTCNISYALVQAASSCLRSFSPSNRAYIYIRSPSSSHPPYMSHTRALYYYYTHTCAYSKSRPKLLFDYHAGVQLDVTRLHIYVYIYIYAICKISYDIYYYK